VPDELTEHGKAAHLGMIPVTFYNLDVDGFSLILRTAHCVDYLRQTLMCHGDLTPITLTYNKTKQFTDPNFRIKHTCRNFDSIWQFAAKRNRSGISIEG
jgi:hypothetical protein